MSGVMMKSGISRSTVLKWLGLLILFLMVLGTDLLLLAFVRSARLETGYLLTDPERETLRRQLPFMADWKPEYSGSMVEEGNPIHVCIGKYGPSDMSALQLMLGFGKDGELKSAAILGFPGDSAVPLRLLSLKPLRLVYSYGGRPRYFSDDRSNGPEQTVARLNADHEHRQRIAEMKQKMDEEWKAALKNPEGRSEATQVMKSLEEKWRRKLDEEEKDYLRKMGASAN